MITITKYYAKKLFIMHSWKQLRIKMYAFQTDKVYGLINMPTNRGIRFTFKQKLWIILIKIAKETEYKIIAKINVILLQQ